MVVTTLTNETFTSDYVVVTVSNGVLKKDIIKFIPDLPDKKKQSIKKIGFGLLDKVILEFDSVFWNNNVDWIGYIS